MTAADHRPNPFHMLGLPVDADEQTVVERAEEGIQTGGTAQERELYDWAMRELIGNPYTRLRYELTEPRPTDYRDARWEAFVRRHRSNPSKLGPRKLQPEDFDLSEAVRRMVRELLHAPVAGAREALEALLDVAGDEAPGDKERELEVSDVLFG